MDIYIKSRHQDSHRFFTPVNDTPNLACQKQQYKLGNCIQRSNISVLEHQNWRESCDPTKWFEICSTAQRRNFIEDINWRQFNRQLYTEEGLKQYNEVLNNRPKSFRLF